MSVRFVVNSAKVLTVQFRSIHRVYSTRERDDDGQRTWRTPRNDRQGEWYSSFKLFAPKKGLTPGLVKVLQSPFTVDAVKRWWKSKKEEAIVLDQRFIPERHLILGCDLAAAHFIVHRGGKVKFHGNSCSFKKDENDEYTLPEKFQPNMVIEAIDVSGVDIRYEGLENLKSLKKLQWLSFQNCPNIDDWCLDRISSEFRTSLIYLNLSHCSQVTERGLVALHRLEKLKHLVVTNIPTSKHFELACLELEEFKPDLKIEGVSYIKLPEE